MPTPSLPSLQRDKLPRLGTSPSGALLFLSLGSDVVLQAHATFRMDTGNCTRATCQSLSAKTLLTYHVCGNLLPTYAVMQDAPEKRSPENHGSFIIAAQQEQPRQGTLPSCTARLALATDQLPF